MAKGPDRLKLAELTFRLGQPVGDRPQCRRVDAKPDMAGEVHLDILGGGRGAQQAGPPVHDAIGARKDRGRRNRQVAGNRLKKLGIVADGFARQRLVKLRRIGRPHIVRKRASERHDIAHHLRRVQREVARVDAAEAPADNADLAAAWLRESRQADRATPRACARGRRGFGPSARHGHRIRVPSDSGASAPSRGRWREIPAMPAPGGHRLSARASTAATSSGWR